jgi:hypothetical protein
VQSDEPDCQVALHFGSLMDLKLMAITTIEILAYLA